MTAICHFIGATSALIVYSSYFHYDVDSRSQNIVEHEFLQDELYDLSSRRFRRAVVPAASTMPPETPVLSQKPQVPTDKPQEPSMMKTENVTYSMNNATNSTTTEASSSPVTTTTVKADAVTNENSSTIIVSQPIIPVTGQPGTIHIWANQTRWANMTQNNTNTKVDNKNTKIDMNKSIELAPNSSISSDLDDISISKFSNFTNNTLTQNNITKTEEDTHRYYNSTFIVDESIGKSFWVDMEKHPDRKVNDLLSKSHRRAATVILTFDFPFYGHKVRNITIATGGFLYTGEYVHSWLAATQYIAPLMANFDTRLSPDSFVKYADNGTAFTVEWTKVVLQDKPNAGAFTFQATLHENGNIVFVYAQMPLSVEAIEDKEHPVKVGLSDAYIMDRSVFLVRRKTIYEYHRVDFNRQEINNWTVIYLRALPTCLQMENCSDCLTKVPEFECKWCRELNQCSTGTFRFRQDWLAKGCENTSIKNVSSCPANPKSIIEHIDDNSNNNHENNRGRVISNGELSASVEPKHLSNELSASDSLDKVNMSHMGVSGVIGILLIVSLIAGIAGWAAYAYRNPHSASGQMLIRYRPSQWSWRRGEARYTAATIHM
ncbi:hypothetical protein PV325_007573 [Microctonus aethiopoides]|nr:hypothetical protein PV325_007573 [Microctonus aethiopoides]